MANHFRILALRTPYHIDIDTNVCVCVCVCVCGGGGGYMHSQLLQLCLTFCNPMDCSSQAPLSMRFSRQEYQSGLLFPPYIYIYTHTCIQWCTMGRAVGKYSLGTDNKMVFCL